MSQSYSLILGGIFAIIVSVFLIDSDDYAQFGAWIGIPGFIILGIGLLLDNTKQKDEETIGFVASGIKKVFSGDFAGAIVDVKSAGKELIKKFDYYGPRILILLIIIGLFAYLLDGFV